MSSPAPVDCTVGTGNMGDPRGTLCIHKHQIHQELGLVRPDFILVIEVTWPLWEEAPHCH